MATFPCGGATDTSSVTFEGQHTKSKAFDRDYLERGGPYKVFRINRTTSRHSSVRGIVRTATHGNAANGPDWLTMSLLPQRFTGSRLVSGAI